MGTNRVWSSIAVAALAALPLLAACAQAPSAQTSPSSVASPGGLGSPSPSALPLTCTSGGPASTSWISPDKADATPSISAAAVSGDTLTLTFVQGTPAFEVTTQPNARFTATDGRGGPVVLSGSAGVQIILRGFRGDMQNYTGDKDFMAGGKTLFEVREIGDYEGVIGWAAGLGQAGCANVTVSASTLTFTFFNL